MSYCKCPRCGGSSFERLKSYAHCAECLHFEDYWQSPESDLAAAEEFLREVEKQALQVVKDDESNLAVSPPEVELDLIGA